MILYVVFMLAVGFALASELAGFTIPSLEFLADPLTQKLSLLLAIFIFVWLLLWLPFRRHEAEKKIQAEEMEKLTSPLQETIKKLESEIESLKAVNKRRFLAFMAQLRAEIDNVKPENWTEFFRSKIPNIQHEVALIEDNFKPKDRDSFQFWVNNLCEIAVEFEFDSSIIHVVNMKIDFLCNFVKDPPNFQ